MVTTAPGCVFTVRLTLRQKES